MSRQSNDQAIGGYFELELPPAGTHFHPEAILYQSARAAFRALLKARRPRKVLVPKYICNAMLSPLIQEAVDYAWYDLDASLNVPNSVELREGEWLLYVNYFGVCQTQVESLLSNYPADQLVFDYSQAFFDPPRLEALATVYSPRKFFGVPDGGMLITSCEVSQKDVWDLNTLSRMKHLLRRLCEFPEEGYQDYLAAESSLEDSTPIHMSRLTQRILASIDYQKVQKKRLENFSFIHYRLKSANDFGFDTSRIVAPLCYPLISNKKGLRELLIKNRVFVPTYWPDARARLGSTWNERMTDGLIPLPIDQRYEQDDMEHILKLIDESVL